MPGPTDRIPGSHACAHGSRSTWLRTNTLWVGLPKATQQTGQIGDGSCRHRGRRPYVAAPTTDHLYRWTDGAVSHDAPTHVDMCRPLSSQYVRPPSDPPTPAAMRAEIQGPTVAEEDLTKDRQVHEPSLRPETALLAGRARHCARPATHRRLGRRATRYPIDLPRLCPSVVDCACVLIHITPPITPCTKRLAEPHPDAPPTSSFLTTR